MRAGRPKKITWDVIFDDFKKGHPTLSKKVLHFRPYDYATILLYLNTGEKLAYNYDTKRAVFVDE